MDDVYLLRNSIQARSILMDMTLGEEDAFTKGTVKEILEIIRTNMEKDLRSELAIEGKQREKAEEKVKEFQKAMGEKGIRIATRVQKGVKTVCYVVEILILAALLISAVYTFPRTLPTFTSGWKGYIASIGQVLLFILSVFNIYAGTTIKSYMRTVEVVLSRKIKNKLSTFFEIQIP